MLIVAIPAVYHERNPCYCVELTDIKMLAARALAGYSYKADNTLLLCADRTA